MVFAPVLFPIFNYLNGVTQFKEKDSPGVHW